MALKDEDFLLKQKEAYDKKLKAMGVEIDKEQAQPFVDELMDRYEFDPTILEAGPMGEAQPTETETGLLAKLKKLWQK